MLGDMLNFLSFGGTCILYGLLSEKKAGNINNFNFLGKNLKVESFLLSKNTLGEKWSQVVATAKELMKTDLKTQIAKKFPLS